MQSSALAVRNGNVDVLLPEKKERMSFDTRDGWSVMVTQQPTELAVTLFDESDEVRISIKKCAGRLTVNLWSGNGDRIGSVEGDV